MWPSGQLPNTNRCVVFKAFPTLLLKAFFTCTTIQFSGCPEDSLVLFSIFNFQKKKNIDNLYFYFFNCLTKNLKRYWVQHNIGFLLPCLNSKVEESVDWSISSIIYNPFDLSFFFLGLVVSFTELGDLQNSAVHHLLFIILLI